MVYGGLGDTGRGNVKLAFSRVVGMMGEVQWTPLARSLSAPFRRKVSKMRASLCYCPDCSAQLSLP